MENPTHSDKPISVEDADKTPVTQSSIDTVHGNEWSDLTISELHNELNILAQRQQAMYSMDKYEIAQQMQRGIDTLRAIITKKQNTRP